MAKDRDEFTPELVAGLVGMVPLVGSLAQPLARHVTTKMMEERERNASVVLQLACQRSGYSREDLNELLEREPALVTLVNRVLYQAAMNGQTTVLQVLAGFLGDALSDTSKIDDVHALLAPIATLSDHHIRVLVELNASSEEPDDLATWNFSALLAAVPIRSEIVLAAIQGLYAGGFAQSRGLDGGDASGLLGGELISITPLGQTLLEVLSAIRSDEGTG
ncbi:hypothetical protein [Nocardioides zeicaulis]|uniref:DUF4393 domain-containing protein n=1 Tax=Nocardioides zeicaulis TaxID=1776857 RepID=A0ABV6E6X4_9ACTN